MNNTSKGAEIKPLCYYTQKTFKYCKILFLNI